MPTSWRSLETELRRGLLILYSAVAVVVVATGASGYLVFNHAMIDPLQRADAVVVLGGDHDGREDYGLSLARDGLAPIVVLSDPYGPTDAVMRRVCRAPSAGIEVICLRPFPMTTRGEAQMMRRLATQRSWNKIIVISWRYHLPRARLVFQQCFSDPGDVVIMRAVPRRYDMSIVDWEFTYVYQYAGLVKAVLQSRCV